MRRVLFVVALLAALVPTSGQSVPPRSRPSLNFPGTAPGRATTRLVDSEIAFSGANVVSSGGLGAALSNELTQAYQVAVKAADKSAARGSDLEIGLSTVRRPSYGARRRRFTATAQRVGPRLMLVAPEGDLAAGAVLH